MRRNLTLDILLMSLFLIFGGSPAISQKNSVFKKVENKTDGGGNFNKTCFSPNEDGEYCFTANVYFAHLDFRSVYNSKTSQVENQAVFPCNLFAGLTIQGLGYTMYASMSQNVEYHYVKEDINNYAHYWAEVEFGCIDIETIQSLVLGPCIEIEDVERGYQILPVSLNIYCNESGDYVPVDYCEDFEKYSDLIYGAEDVGDCSLQSNTKFKICCSNKDFLPMDHHTMRNETLQIKSSNLGIYIDGIQHTELEYSIYNMNGIRILSNTIDGRYKSSEIISNEYLENGIYILVISGEAYHSSHKFISLR